MPLSRIVTHVTFFLVFWSFCPFIFLHLFFCWRCHVSLFDWRISTPHLIPLNNCMSSLSVSLSLPQFSPCYSLSSLIFPFSSSIFSSSLRFVFCFPFWILFTLILCMLFPSLDSTIPGGYFLPFCSFQINIVFL